MSGNAADTPREFIAHEPEHGWHAAEVTTHEPENREHEPDASGTDRNFHDIALGKWKQMAAWRAVRWRFRLPALL